MFSNKFQSDSNKASSAQYVPFSVLKKPYSAPILDVVVFLFTSEQRKNAQSRPKGYALGWDRVVKGELTVVSLSGSHETHFRGKNAEKIVEVLMPALEE